jgi:hypothetical protein
MAALTNPRYEAFAHAIVQGLGQGTSQGSAYVAAGYQAKDAGKRGGSAEAAASRLLNKVKPILQRVIEIQDQARAKAKVTIETIANELDEARGVAKANDQASAMVAATATKAKLYGLQVDKQEVGRAGDFSQASSVQAIADKLLTEAGASTITDDMRAMMIGELSRHSACIEAIATGKASAA